MRQGDVAPAAQLALHNGVQASLVDLWRSHPVVLFFYPKDNTAICTKEACGFRDAYEAFVAAGATVVGVSANSTASHEQFAAKHRLPYLLATDADGSVRRAFGVSDTLGLIPKRVTFVIDRQGVIRHRFSALFAAERHVQEALAAVRALA
jgi:thioredoxin-dependent peroxiredoxin